MLPFIRNNDIKTLLYARTSRRFLLLINFNLIRENIKIM